MMILMFSMITYHYSDFNDLVYMYLFHHYLAIINMSFLELRVC
jgi:hypothetical protein